MNWVRGCVWSPGLVAILAVLATAIGLSGCGMPGAPLPPTLNLAVPVKDLAATRAGNQVSLTWTMPKKNTDKLVLKGIQNVVVCRKEVGAGHCSSVKDLQLAPDAMGEFAEALPAELIMGAPRELAYFVEIKNNNGRSAGTSNAALVLAGEAPEPVTGLEAQIRKEGVVLHWTPAEHEPVATSIRLHRKLLTPVQVKANTSQQGPLAAPSEPAELTLLVEASGQGGRSLERTLDKDIRFGETYEYRAQRVIQLTLDGQVQELDGPLSPPVQVGVLDVFPPDAPSGLAAIAVAGDNGDEPGVDLSWQPDTETDLAGYIVYRREEDGSWQRISPAEPVVGPAFHDARVQTGHGYSYAVTAIDLGGHESERSGEAEETVPSP